MRIRLPVLALLAALVMAACSPADDEESPQATETPPTPPAPEAPPDVGAVCDDTAPGPEQAPDGAVAIDPDVEGDLLEATESNPPGSTFWLAPGTHTLGGEEFTQVRPEDEDTFLGAPGAVLDGQETNQYAFAGEGTDVTITHLVVQNFVAPNNQGVVNHDSADGWVLEHNTIQHNAGAGMMAGTGQQVIGNCLRENGQYGMNAFQSGNEITDLRLEGNEIVGNNTDDWESKMPGCGCTGGVKFWSVDGADIIDNWVHDNRGAGLWADTNNNDFLIENNRIENNDRSAIFYEASYNAVIKDNTLLRNNWVGGKDFADRGDAFPAPTIYLSEAGGEPRIPARTDAIEIHDNVLEDNWSGITVWENADRFCNSPANTSAGLCTLLVPEEEICAQPDIAEGPLYDDCRWKSQRVHIHDNTFAVDPEVLECDSRCTRMAVLANFGTFPGWSPYQGEVVREAITFGQDNRWYDNTYIGPWTFIAGDLETVLDAEEWQDSPYNQDAGSTFESGGDR